MALSNWDTLAFNKDGNPSIGEVENLSGAKIEIYKNWVYVSCERMWVPGLAYAKPTIAEIRHGDVHLAGFNIRAKRGSQNSVMVIADYHDEGYNPYYFGGIGAYGYENSIPRKVAELGLDPSWTWFEGTHYHIVDEVTGEHVEDDLLTGVDPEGGLHEVLYKRYAEPERRPRAQWLGVTPETLGEFFEFAESGAIELDNAFKAWLDKCKVAPPIRYNQGDAYFSEAVGVSDLIQATQVGESRPPVIENIIQNMDKVGIDEPEGTTDGLE